MQLILYATEYEHKKNRKFQIRTAKEERRCRYGERAYQDEAHVWRQPHRVFYRLKEKAVKAGISIAELLRIGAFKLSIVERLTDFERDAIRELMYQGKNLNDQVKAC